MFADPNEYWPSVAQDIGRGPMLVASAATKRTEAKHNETVQTPMAYLGSYPVFSGDDDIGVPSLCTAGIPQGVPGVSKGASTSRINAFPKLNKQTSHYDSM